MDDSRQGKLIVQSGGFPGQEYKLTLPENIIGRNPGVPVVIEHQHVSRQHARILVDGDLYYLEDMGSSNGTFLNGQRVVERSLLHSGDEIRLGQEVVLVFQQPQPVKAAPATVLERPNETFIETPSAPAPAQMKAAAPQSVPAEPAAQLMITVGDNPPRSIPLDKDRLTLGRSEDNDVVVDSKVISRHHAVLQRVAGGFEITALPDVKNPLLLNDLPLVAPYCLKPGDVIQVGLDAPDLSVSLALMAPKTGQAPSAYQQPVVERPIPQSDIPRTAPPAQATTAAAPTADKYSPARPPAQQAPQSRPTLGADGVMAPAVGFQPAGFQPGTYQPPDGGTMVESALGAVGGAPSQLVVTVAGQPPQTYTLEAPRITIGRADDNDIVVPSLIVSRHHATLHRGPTGYEIEVAQGVTNTLVCQGKPVTGRQALKHGDVLRIDSEIPGMMVSMTYVSPGTAFKERQTFSVQFGNKDKLTFGRDPANDVVLNMPTISRFHAQVVRVGRRYNLTDLRSANGTFVNNKPIEGEVWLQANDTIRMGPYRFVLGEDQFVRYDDTKGLRVETVGVNKWVRKNLNLLQDISLVFQPREFIVVVGQSGGGKSTLVDAIAGYRPATHGKVTVNGIDVYKNFDAIRNEIGYVPQKDIIHMELTVYQALDYAAKLRMPRDTSKAERHKRIMEVLEDLDLTHRKDMQISGLSGGQQKRVSIGVELLTRPGLFFLDEPTSGLDPGTETAFMHLMRRLADQGRTIIMVTHATKNVMLADKVVFLARGGYMAWFGPPDEALQYFDQYRSERDRRAKPMEFDQIYAILDDPSKGTAKEWAARFRAHPAYQKYIVQPLQERGALPLAGTKAQPSQANAARSARKRTRVSSIRQFFVLSARNIKILTRDRTSLILMLAAAPMVGSLDFILAPMMGKNIFDFNQGDPGNGPITLFLLTIYCLLVGGLSQMREFVKEADIYKRERLVNLRIIPYISSKIWVAMLLAFIHAAAYTIIHNLAFKMPGGWLAFGLMYITLVLAVMTGMIGGLLVSAFAPNGNSAPMLMILLIVPLIVLSGALAPVPDTISSVASSRWAFQGLVGITGMGSDVAADPCWKLPEQLRDNMSLAAKESAGCRCMGVAVFKTCNFPGIGVYYKPEIDEAAPLEPPALADRPPEPVIPPAPTPPEDKFDQVKMAQYLNALSDYQNQVNAIQDDYKNKMKIYEAEADVYKNKMTDYQEAKTKYELSRNGAVKGAEELIKSVLDKFGFGFVNKNDPAIFWPWMFRAWIAQVLIIFTYIVLIFIFIKRKDAI